LRKFGYVKVIVVAQERRLWLDEKHGFLLRLHTKLLAVFAVIAGDAKNLHNNNVVCLTAKIHKNLSRRHGETEKNIFSVPPCLREGKIPFYFSERKKIFL
jgi:hypothetical protein